MNLLMGLMRKSLGAALWPALCVTDTQATQGWVCAGAWIILIPSGLNGRVCTADKLPWLARGT